MNTKDDDTRHVNDTRTGAQVASLTRRRLMQTTATAAGVAAVGGAAMQTDALDSPVREAEAAAGFVVPAAKLVLIGAGLAGAGAVIRWLRDRIGSGGDLDELRSELAQLDVDAAALTNTEVARAIDAQETQHIIEREQRFNFSTTLSGASTSIDEYGNDQTISYLDTAWTEVRAGAGAEFAVGGDAESAGEVAKERARLTETAAAVTVLENANANLESLAYALADQASRDSPADNIKIGSDSVEPGIAGGTPGSNVDVLASDYAENDPVVISIPLDTAEDYPEASELRETTDDYEPRLHAVYTTNGDWIPAVGIDDLPFEYADSTTGSAVESSSEDIYASHPDVSDGEEFHAHVGSSFDAGVTQLRSAADQLIDHDIGEFVINADEQIEEGGLAPSDLIGARELTGQFSDTSNFSRFAAELVGAGFEMPGDGALGTQAEVRHEDLADVGVDADVDEINKDIDPEVMRGLTDGTVIALSGDATVIERVDVGSGDTLSEIPVSDVLSDPDNESVDAVTVSSDDARWAVVSDAGEFVVGSFDDDDGFVVDARHHINDAGYEDGGYDPHQVEVTHDGVVVTGGSRVADVLRVVDVEAGTLETNTSVEWLHDVDINEDAGIVYAAINGTGVRAFELDDVTTEADSWDNQSDEAHSVAYNANAGVLVAGRYYSTSSESSAENDVVTLDPDTGDELDVLMEDGGNGPTAGYLSVSSSGAVAVGESHFEEYFRVFDSDTGDELTELTDGFSGDPADVRKITYVGSEFVVSDVSTTPSTFHLVRGDLSYLDEQVAIGHLFIDTSAAKTIEAGATFSETEYDTAYILTIEEGEEDHTAVLMHSDNDELVIEDVIIDEDAEDAAEDTEDAVDEEIDEEEDEGLDSEETPEDDDDEDTDLGTITADHYIEVPGDDDDINELSDRGDVTVRVRDVATDDVLETRPASDIEWITVDGEGLWALPVEENYTDVRLTFDAGFTTTQPVEGEQDPSDPDDIKERADDVGDAREDIEDARQDAAGAAMGGSGGMMTLLFGGGVIAAILYLFGRTEDN